jgi:hypothetical protein
MQEEEINLNSLSSVKEGKEEEQVSSILDRSETSFLKESTVIIESDEDFSEEEEHGLGDKVMVESRCPSALSLPIQLCIVEELRCPLALSLTIEIYLLEEELRCPLALSLTTEVYIAGWLPPIVPYCKLFSARRSRKNVSGEEEDKAEVVFILMFVIWRSIPGSEVAWTTCCCVRSLCS